MIRLLLFLGCLTAASGAQPASAQDFHFDLFPDTDVDRADSLDLSVVRAHYAWSWKAPPGRQTGFIGGAAGETDDPFADDPVWIEGLGSRPPFHRFLWGKTSEIVTTPLQWRSNDWLNSGIMVAGLRLVASLDDPVTRWVQDNRGSTSLLNRVGPLGEEYSFAVIGGFYVAGKLFHNEKAGLVARDSITSSIIAAGLITPALKLSFGRERPRDSDDADAFHPFQGGHSFPSGHTTQAFAVAGSIAAHYDQRWVKITSYSLASLVGLSRIEADAHYVSDVVAGAFIGTWVSRKVTGKHRKSDRFWWEPYLGREGAGVSLKFGPGARGR